MENIVHLILCETSDICADTLPFVTETDRAEAERCAQPDDKIVRLVSLCLKRKYIGSWSIGEHGKPVADGKFFNVSHTKGAVVLALADNDVGVDIERVRPTDKKFYAYVSRPDELAIITDDLSFFTVWTAKESLVKAAGTGFDLHPKNVPVLPLIGTKTFKNNVYFSQQTVLGDLVISVTRKGETPFSLVIEKETFN